MFDVSFLARSLVESAGIDPDDMPQMYERFIENLSDKIVEKLKKENLHDANTYTEPI